MTAASKRPAAPGAVVLRLSPELRGPRAPSERIEITRGVEDVGGRVVGRLAYRDGAICPRADWRPAARDELEALLADAGDANAHAGLTIDIAPAPAPLLDAFARGGLHPGRTEQDYAAAVRRPDYTATLHSALPALAPMVASPDGLQLLGTCVQAGDLWSTTTHTDRGQPERFSGLHVDNWDRLPPGERKRGRRQMCINLGAGDRFFVFARCDVDTIVAALGTAFDRAQSYIGIGRAWFARVPDALLVRVRVRPGEMYVAPTDNLIHDGSTLGSTAPDITLNLRGHFRIAPSDVRTIDARPAADARA